MTSDARNSQIPSLPFASPVSGRSSTVYGIFIAALCPLSPFVSLSRFLGFELRTEVLGRARHTVLVRRAVDDRLGEEVAVSRRRRRRPLEGRRFPRILVHGLAPEDAREEVDDERQLEESQRPGGHADPDVQLQRQT